MTSSSLLMILATNLQAWRTHEFNLALVTWVEYRHLYEKKCVYTVIVRSHARHFLKGPQYLSTLIPCKSLTISHLNNPHSQQSMRSSFPKRSFYELSPYAFSHFCILWETFKPSTISFSKQQQDSKRWNFRVSNPEKAFEDDFKLSLWISSKYHVVSQNSVSSKLFSTKAADLWTHYLMIIKDSVPYHPLKVNFNVFMFRHGTNFLKLHKFIVSICLAACSLRCELYRV